VYRDTQVKVTRVYSYKVLKIEMFSAIMLLALVTIPRIFLFYIIEMLIMASIRTFFHSWKFSDLGQGVNATADSPFSSLHNYGRKNPKIRSWQPFPWGLVFLMTIGLRRG
jgi:hypothetical protein